MGHILFTIFGHEGPTTTASFSPAGDYILSGGKDANICIWASNLSPMPTENLNGVKKPAIDTQVFVTDKERIHKLPDKKMKQI